MFIKFTSATTQLLHFSLALLIGLLSCTSALHADDLEIYLINKSTPANFLFVLDQSGSMNDCLDGNHGSNCPGNNRMDILKNSLNAVVDAVEGSNGIDINMGILGYTALPPTGTAEPKVHSLNAHSDFKLVSDSATELKASISNLVAGGGTPTQTALYKAIEWYKDGGIEIDADDTHVPGFTQNYDSPIPTDPDDFVCGENNIMLLTDGASKHYSTHDNLFGAWGSGYQYEGATCTVPALNTIDPVTNQKPRFRKGITCMTEMAQYGQDTDLKTGVGWEGTQNIKTHTVYFESGIVTNPNAPINAMSIVKDVAQAGNGFFFLAEDQDGLINAFFSVIESTIDQGGYTSPSIPFNSTNTAVTGNSIYIPMFAPNKKMFWKGNLKKFDIEIENGAVSIVTNNDSNAFNDAGIFNDVTDYWNGTGGSDDGDPLIGGVASQMTGTRNLYSKIHGSNNLTHTQNRVRYSNNLIYNNMMGVSDNATRKELLDWVSWTDTTNEHENEMGAPLHTNPIAVEYGSVNNSDVVIYLPTSEGVLEAIDEDTGEELWAFMPKELLTGIKTIKDNISSYVPYYGLDGHLTIYDIGNKKFAAFGMRRGGSNYYILDITNKTSPKYVATISPSSAGFTNLGQTWSKPIHMKMYINGGDKDVLVFGGGYDEDHDNHSDDTTRTTSSKGNRIYIVDAEDGDHLKTIDTLENGSLDYSIVGDIVPVDINANGIIDRLYAADIGGQIIRVDIQDEGMQAPGTITAGIVADVNAGGGWRRFFNTPVIGFYNKGGVASSVILIGSGNRESPTNSTTTDRFYMIKDIDVWSIPDYDATGADAYEIVKGWDEGSTGDLYNATNNDMSNDSSLAAVASAKGWFIDFESTEKSYSKPVLWQNNIMFTTLQAQDLDDSCDSEITRTTYGYFVSLDDASAAHPDVDDVNGLSPSDRKIQLKNTGIPSSPLLLYPDEGAGKLSSDVLGIFDITEDSLKMVDKFLPISWEEVIE